MDSLGRTRGICGCVSCKDCPFRHLGVIDSYGNITKRCYDAAYLDPKKFTEVVMNYEIPIDWNNVKVDTPVYVRSDKSCLWLPRYFAKYENDVVYTWDFGATSFSSTKCSPHNYAKLAEDITEGGIE